jgi:hypothetical protein
MPLRGLDFKRSNQAIARFNQFLQYDLLDQMRTDRDVAVLEVSDRLMRERQKEGGEIEKNVAEFKSSLTDKEAYTKAMLDIAKLPEADYLVSMARLATDKNLPPQFHEPARGAAKKYASIVLPLAQAYYNASRGIGTANDAFAALKGGGVQGLTDYMEQSGMNIRAQQVAQTAAGEQGVQREKIAAEGEGRTQAQMDKMSERFIAWIGDTVKFLEAEGVQGESMIDAIFAEAKVRDPLMSEYRGSALQFLNQLKANVIRSGADALTDGNIAFITKAWNTPAIQGFVSENLTKVEGGEVVPGRKRGQPAPKPKKGGLPSPETGMSAADTERSAMGQRADQVQQYAVEWLQSKYPGADPKTYTQADWDTAKARAEAWIRILRGESTVEQEMARAEQEAAGTPIRK